MNLWPLGFLTASVSDTIRVTLQQQKTPGLSSFLSPKRSIRNCRIVLLGTPEFLVKGARELSTVANVPARL